jgi:hypothetical protein
LFAASKSFSAAEPGESDRNGPIASRLGKPPVPVGTCAAFMIWSAPSSLPHVLRSTFSGKSFLIVAITLAAIALRMLRPWPILLTAKTSLTPMATLARQLL